MGNRQRGFTILEMAIAIGVFAIIAAISYSTLITFLDTRDQIGARHTELRQLQFLFSLLEQDIRFITRRPVRDEFGDIEPPLMVNPGDSQTDIELIRFTTAHPDPSSPDWFRLQRVAWRFEDGNLYRVTWRVLDRDRDTPEVRRLVYEDLTQLDFSFFKRAENNALDGSREWDDEEALPEAVEVVAVTGKGIAYRRLLEVAGGA